MCGIVGWLSTTGGVDEAVVTAMRERLAHRGPDGARTTIEDGGRVGFGHRRLAIIDLDERAAQPMEDADGRALICFNGEIYNHRALRAELESAGARFRTDHSDTEVLLQGYLKWGLEELLRRCIGMFAFALHDRAAGVVHLVRDRVGIKPLSLMPLPGGLVFASETKALFAHPAARPALDRENFFHYLSFRSLPSPHSLFAGVEKLPAGWRAEYRLADGQLTRMRWWDPLDAGVDPPRSRGEAVDRLESLLEESFALRMESDVPVGLFLSGGLDSGYLMTLLGERGPGSAAFTVRYPGHEAYNEDTDARRLAAAARADYHDVVVDDRAFVDALSAVAYHQDEPIAAPVCTSVYFLSKAARAAGVPVVLTGEGSDELFAGYPNWLRLRDMMRWDRRLPDLPGRPLRRAAAALFGATCSSWDPRREILDRAALGRPLSWGGAIDFGERAKSRLVGPEVPTAGLDTYEALVAPAWQEWTGARGFGDPTGWMSWMDLRFRLPELMLPRVDKMGMAFSIEGRVPFLDHRIAELVFAIPPEWRGGTGKATKALFKDVASRRLEPEFVYRRKRGFQAPVKEWRETVFRERLGPALEAFARRTGLLDPDALRDLLARPGDRLYFSLVNVLLWHEIFLEPVVEDLLPGVREAAGVSA
jgi:asparagine synthase (glutamine-hydrolysing)